MCSIFIDNIKRWTNTNQSYNIFIISIETIIKKEENFMEPYKSQVHIQVNSFITFNTCSYKFPLYKLFNELYTHSLNCITEKGMHLSEKGIKYSMEVK